MTGIDYVIVGVLVLSALVSLVRGFVKEALSLASWIIALWVALTLSSHLATLLRGVIAAPSLRLIIAFVLLFLVALVLGAAVNRLVSGLVKRTGLTGTDRAVGVLFGVARGVVLIALLVLVAKFTRVPEDPWWQRSMLIPRFEAVAVWLQDFVPVEVTVSESSPTIPTPE